MNERAYTLSLLQMNIQIGEPDVNYKKLDDLMQQAMKQEPRPDVIMFPELWNTGYALEHVRDIADRDGERTIATLSAFARQHRVNIVAGSIADLQADHMYNQIYVFNRSGEVISTYSKIHLFRLMDEEKYLTSGQRLGAMHIDEFPSAMMICYDIRFPELSRKLALGGAKILYVPAQWPHPRLHHWRTLLMARAIENQMYVIACNRVGESKGASFFGHSLVINPWGEILAEGSEEEEILQATIDLDLVDRVRSSIPVFEDRKPHLYE